MFQYSADARYRATAKEKSGYEKVRRADIEYSRKLRAIARNVGMIVNHFPAGDPKFLNKIQELLDSYAAMIRPWAEVVGAKMLADVNYRDTKNWSQLTANMGAAMRAELLTAPTGEVYRKLQSEQVHLITSIPRKAAERVHKLTMEGLSNATRADEIKRDIQRTSHVEESRATLIARTEVGRAATSLAQARAEHVGSEGYIWRTAEDADVRASHRRLNGTFQKWDKPPLCDPPDYHAHAGAIFNCRCYTDIVLPKEFLR